MYDLVSLTLTVINWRYLLNAVIKITRLGCRPTLPIIPLQILQNCDAVSSHPANSHLQV